MSVKRKHFAFQTMGAATQVGLKSLKGSRSVETKCTWLPCGSCGMLRTSRSLRDAGRDGVNVPLCLVWLRLYPLPWKLHQVWLKEEAKLLFSRTFGVCSSEL